MTTIKQERSGHIFGLHINNVTNMCGLSILMQCNLREVVIDGQISILVISILVTISNSGNKYSGQSGHRWANKYSGQTATLPLPGGGYQLSSLPTPPDSLTFLFTPNLLQFISIAAFTQF